MASGAPKATVTYINKGQFASSATGYPIGMVGDFERGPVDRNSLITTQTQLANVFGENNPYKYGISYLEAQNALTKSDKVYIRRVDKGQLYGTALLRSKINSMSLYDDQGNPLAEPTIDYIVKPNGEMSIEDIEAYQFEQYYTTREVASFEPIISLTDVPQVGDTKIKVDSYKPIDVGTKITFKDTTGMASTEVTNYAIYTVTAKEQELVNQEYIFLDGNLSEVNYGAVIRKAIQVASAYSNPIRVAVANESGDTVLYVVPTDDQIAEGHVIRLGDVDYTIQSIAKDEKEVATGFTATGNTGEYSLTVSGEGNGLVEIENLTTVILNGAEYTVASVEDNVLLLNEALEADYFGTTLTAKIEVLGLTLDNPISGVMPALYQVLRVVTTYESYSTDVYAKSVSLTDFSKIQVNNNDPVNEGDLIELEGNLFTVVSKSIEENYEYTLTLNQEYANQQLLYVGSEVYHVVQGDTEFHDCALIYGANPGEWNDKLAIACRPHEYYEDAFYIDVYESGVLMETHTVSRNNKLDGYSKQMEWENVINNGSDYIRVKDNAEMIDSEGNKTLPLFTTYYVRQPVPDPIYTTVATTLETLWDGDNLITVGVEGIQNVNLNNKVMIGDGIYTIASFKASVTGGEYDTIVLETVLDLGMEDLPKAQRYLPIGTEVKQQVTQQQVERISIVDGVAEGSPFTVEVNGQSFTCTATIDDTVSTILGQLVTLINTDMNVAVYAVASTEDDITYFDIKATVAGTGFDLIVTSNLVRETIQENVSPWTYYVAEIIDNSIVPSQKLEAEVEMSEGTYYIRDAGANRFTGGSDGDTATVGQYILAAQSAFGSKENVDIIALWDAGICYPEYQKALNEICEDRKDCIWVGSVPYDTQTSSDIQKVIDYRQDTLAVDSQWGYLITPWIEIYDADNDASVWVPPTSDIVGKIAENGEAGRVWDPVAGWTNGLINRATNVYREYESGERDVLYEAGLNSVRKDSKGRIAVWGQKSLSIEESPLTRIDVTLKLIVVGRMLLEYLEDEHFTINDENNRARHKANIEVQLSNYQTKGAIKEFVVKCDEENNPPSVEDAGELYLDVGIKVYRNAEFLFGRITLTANQNASFEIV